MKNSKTILFCGSVIALLLIIMTGCKKDPSQSAPVACISSLPDSVLVFATVNFNSSCSSGGLTYLWDFGDGSTSAVATATHAYTASGTYTVTLTVTNAHGTNTKTQNIVITGCNLGYEGTNCATEVRSKFFATNKTVSENCPIPISYTVDIVTSSSGVTKFKIKNLGNYACGTGDYYVELTLTDNTHAVITTQTVCAFTFSGNAVYSASANTLTITYTATYGTPQVTDNCTTTITY